MSENINPLEQLKTERMGIGQWFIVFICVGILALDGYDVLSIAFAAPGMTAEWGLSKAALGFILPLELIGMAMGSIFIGAWTDQHGRRPTMLLGLIVLTIGMAVAGFSPNVYILGVARVFTGIGIGGLLVTATATTSDFCNDKNRSLAVVMVAGGFPLGIYLGATFLAPLLGQYDWRVTFHLGAALSLIFIPMVYLFVPETISFLERKRPDNSLERIRKTMTRLGHLPPERLEPQTAQDTIKTGVVDLFKPATARLTYILIFAYFANIATYYYFVKWLPTIVTDLGHTASEATKVLGVISLGGVIGSIGMSVMSRFLPVKWLMFFSLVLSALGVWMFPYFTDTISEMKFIGFFTGLFILASISGFFGLFSTSFQSALLGSGTGLVLGVGRGGAVLGPMIPGLLFTAGLALNNVALIMGAGSFLAGMTILLLKNNQVEGP